MTVIDAGTILNAGNVDAVESVCNRFSVSMADMASEIVSKLTPETIRLGTEWYREAHAFCVEMVEAHDSRPLTVPVVAAVVSSLSPRMGWVRNKEITHAVISGWTQGKSADQIKGALGANIRMAAAILDGAPISETLTGVKRRSFYNNIVTAGASNDVTIDTWMQRVAMAVSPDRGMDLDDSLRFLTARKHSGYIAIATAVRAVAEQMNLSPATVQAAYWIAATGSVHGWHWKGKGITDANNY